METLIPYSFLFFTIEPRKWILLKNHLYYCKNKKCKFELKTYLLRSWIYLNLKLLLGNIRNDLPAYLHSHFQLSLLSMKPVSIKKKWSKYRFSIIVRCNLPKLWQKRSMLLRNSSSSSRLSQKKILAIIDWCTNVPQVIYTKKIEIFVCSN